MKKIEEKINKEIIEEILQKFENENHIIFRDQNQARKLIEKALSQQKEKLNHSFISKVRKETVEMVCSEIIKNIKIDYPKADTDEQHKFQIIGAEHCQKIIKEKIEEIKERILNNL